ncbi:unnamed protein product [Effrenium voratum]|uniref:OPA3-like protein n=1 Tax=Effrenium voratum TaxID=2562239 RepID=A0AA36JTD6_9DINO|nr:unnamed protein product [Effrenium voratum]CAJ1411554.1 unnamed protein product [Effrenium voratum]CAJ1418339.1 unnamed protein product [Effrenium voratum]
MVVLMLSKLPVGKLMLLGVRQAARPVAKVAMAAAERSRTFQDCCVAASQLMQTERLHLPHDQAVQAGCTMLGEAVVFGVSGVVLIYEYHRSKEAERQRQEDAREEIRREAAASRAELRVRMDLLVEELERHRADVALLRMEVARTKKNAAPVTGGNHRPGKSGAALAS